MKIFAAVVGKMIRMSITGEISVHFNKNELMPDHPDYQLWYGAVRRVNKMLPMERISFRNTFQQLPSYQLRTPISRSVPPGSSTLHVNTSQSFQPMNIGQPHTSTLELNTSPFINLLQREFLIQLKLSREIEGLQVWGCLRLCK